MKILILVMMSFTAFAKIEIQGHRGARSVRPENTLAAFKYALDQGVDTLELDTVMTKDNVVVISHNPTVEEVICEIPKKMKRPVVIRNLSFKELGQFDCGKKKHPKYPEQVPVPGEKIPSLEQLFEMTKDNETIKYNIETKINPVYEKLFPKPKSFVKAILALVKKYKLEKRTVIQSFDYRTLLEVKKQDPSIRTAFLAYGSYFDFTILLDSFPFDIYSPNYKWMTKEMVKKFHKKGVEVIPWTANDKESWDHLIKIGADGIITDHPKALMDYLKKKKIQ